jgi:hypothetical protein
MKKRSFLYYITEGALRLITVIALIMMIVSVSAFKYGTLIPMFIFIASVAWLIFIAWTYGSFDEEGDDEDDALL